MDEVKIKKYFYLSLIVLFLVSAFGVVSFIGAYTESLNPVRTFTVTGEGKALAKNDIAQFTYSIVEQGDKDLTKIKLASDKKSQAIMSYLTKEGVAEKDIQTTSYNVEPRYQYYQCNNPLGADSSARPCPPADIVGYTITISNSVKVRDLAKAGNLLSGVVANGANTVSQLSFSVDDETAVKNSARTEAMDKARAQAKQIAKAGGFRIGRLVSVDESSAPNYPYLMDARSMMKGGAEVASVPAISAGSQETTVNVTLRYEIR